jgi:hypothetical protein
MGCSWHLCELVSHRSIVEVSQSVSRQSVVKQIGAAGPGVAAGAL